MNTKWILTALCATLIAAGPTGAFAQKKNTGELKLVGIKLYDSGVRVVSLYGNPDIIEPLSIGGGGGGIGGGGGAGGRGPAAGGGPGRGGPGAAPAGPRMAGAGSADFTGPDSFGASPDSFGDTLLRQKGDASAPSGPMRRPDGVGGPGGGGPRGPGGSGSTGAPGSSPFNSGGGGGGIEFTRWVYKRNGCRYGFVLDHYMHVVQIEAIGLHNGKVKTAKGVTFGSTFSTIIKRYGTPEGYEISGDTIVMRYLVKNKVAFRLSRVAENKPQVVTGIAVAAGKA